MVVDALLNGLCAMDWADYLRDQATMYRQLAEQTDDPAVQNEMLELASVCEEVAAALEFQNSAEYQEISIDRKAGADALVLQFRGLP
jgi:hypothetical protein